jgi:hypothetical protein
MKVKLAHKPKEPSLREVRQQMLVEIEIAADSYREPDGVIRDEQAIGLIGRFQKALKLLSVGKG